MKRRERLEGLAEVLMLAAEKASVIAQAAEAHSAVSREAALAKQLEGIAMEYRAIASILPRATHDEP